jgi:hypothetical protein
MRLVCDLRRFLRGLLEISRYSAHQPASYSANREKLSNLSTFS